MENKLKTWFLLCGGLVTIPVFKNEFEFQLSECPICLLFAIENHEHFDEFLANLRLKRKEVRVSLKEKLRNFKENKDGTTLEEVRRLLGAYVSNPRVDFKTKAASILVLDKELKNKDLYTDEIRDVLSKTDTKNIDKFFKVLQDLRKNDQFITITFLVDKFIHGIFIDWAPCECYAIMFRAIENKDDALQKWLNYMKRDLNHPPPFCELFFFPENSVQYRSYVDKFIEGKDFREIIHNLDTNLIEYDEALPTPTANLFIQLLHAFGIVLLHPNIPFFQKTCYCMQVAQMIRLAHDEIVEELDKYANLLNIITYFRRKNEMDSVYLQLGFVSMWSLDENERKTLTPLCQYKYAVLVLDLLLQVLESQLVNAEQKNSIPITDITFPTVPESVEMVETFEETLALILMSLSCFHRGKRAKALFEGAKGTGSLKSDLTKLKKTAEVASPHDISATHWSNFIEALICILKYPLTKEIFIYLLAILNHLRKKFEELIGKHEDICKKMLESFESITKQVEECSADYVQLLTILYMNTHKKFQKAYQKNLGDFDNFWVILLGQLCLIELAIKILKKLFLKEAPIKKMPEINLSMEMLFLASSFSSSSEAKVRLMCNTAASTEENLIQEMSQCKEKIVKNAKTNNSELMEVSGAFVDKVVKILISDDLSNDKKLSLLKKLVTLLRDLIEALMKLTEDIAHFTSDIVDEILEIIRVIRAKKGHNISQLIMDTIEDFLAESKLGTATKSAIRQLMVLLLFYHILHFQTHSTTDSRAFSVEVDNVESSLTLLVEANQENSIHLLFDCNMY